MDPDEDEFYQSLFKLHDENNDKKLNENQLIDIFNTVNDGYLSLQQVFVFKINMIKNRFLLKRIIVNIFFALISDFAFLA